MQDEPPASASPMPFIPSLTRTRVEGTTLATSMPQTASVTANIREDWDEFPAAALARRGAIEAHPAGHPLGAGGSGGGRARRLRLYQIGRVQRRRVAAAHQVYRMDHA